MYNLGNKSDNTAGDAGSLPAAQFNDFKNESENAITTTGQSLTAGTGDDVYQLAKAMATHAARGDFMVDGGIADAISLTAVASMQTPIALVTGLRVRTIPAFSNTGAATLAYPSLGTKAIRTTADVDPAAGAYTAGVPCEFMYVSTFNGSAGGWAIINNGGGGGVTLPVGISDGGTGETTAYAGFDALTVQGANIASAATTNLATATGVNVTVTGSTTITAFGTANAGVFRIVRFSGAPLITHNATSLICLGGADVQAAAGDVAIFRSEGSGNWRMVAYSQASAPPTNSGRYVSAYQTYTAAGSVYTFAHGLSAAPSEFCAYARNINADNGYTTGDYVQLPDGIHTGAGAAEWGTTVYADATNIYIVVADDGASIITANTTIFNGMGLNDWEFRVVYRA
jgi:hypothetical protein